MDAMLTAMQVAVQEAGGTWRELFSRTALINQSALAAVLAWLGLVALVGAVFYPMTRLVFAGLRDHGWGISRLFGLLLLGLTVWLIASFGGGFTRTTITIVFMLWAAINFMLFVFGWKEIFSEIRDNLGRIGFAELFFVGLFLFFLLIRLGNPDLWHPYKGGEKPMDFAYFNAVIKSSTMPPYDPWFSGGSLNYYYYGFFLSGLLTKWIGMIPSVAYNLILSTWFAFLGMGAFSIGSTLYGTVRHGASEAQTRKAGLLSVLFLQLIGNLGTYGIFLGQLVKLGERVVPLTDSGWSRVWAFFAGIGQLFQGQKFQLYPGDWYWIPSRAIPGEPITEFPMFTFLYGDPHAHLFALPITVLSLAWIVSLTRFRLSASDGTTDCWARWVVALSGGAVILGALLPTNTWDFPTFFLIAAMGVALTVWRWHGHSGTGGRRIGSLWKLMVILTSIGLMAVLTWLFYGTYFETNFRDSGISPWSGDRTPIASYWMHWGLFLFVIVTSYSLETLDWMKSVRVSRFRKFYSQIRLVLFFVVLGGLFLIGWFHYSGAHIAKLAFPLMAWTLILMLRSDRSAAQRTVYFWVGTALFITIFVEFFCLKGDLGRMNMVFKLYLQAWSLFSLSAAFGAALLFMGQGEPLHKAATKPAGLAETDESDTGSTLAWEIGSAIWMVIFCVLLCGGLLFTVTATADKITDRMDRNAPHTLDGMTFMETSTYSQDGFTMDLGQDAAAIRFLQDTVIGSPVLVEGHATEYKWGNRMTNFTGLPSVIGWNYHQRQQRPLMHTDVWDRVNDVKAFYDGTRLEEALAFIMKYRVAYIVVGQLERGLYAPEGIAKFDAFDGQPWMAVYRDRDTAIYQVDPTLIGGGGQ